MTQVKDLVDAYDAFITGCKADGTWNAIKASCIMAGWDNLDGALTPLVGTAPTNTNFSGAADPYWSNVSLLLRGEGADGGTTFTDSSSNTLAATVTASIVLSTKASSGKFGSGISYVNTGQYNASIIYNNPVQLQFGTGDFTWEAWIRPDAASSAGFYNVLWDSRASGESYTNRLYIDFYGNLSVTARAVVAGTSIPTSSLSVGQWYHFAVCRSSGVSRVFLNGVLQGSVSDSSNYSNGTSRPVLFNNLNLNIRGAGHSVDEIRVTKGVARYTSDFTIPATAFPGSSSSDYSRKTGLDQNGDVSKWLDSNYSNQSASRQNNNHQAIWATKVQANIFLLGNNFGTGGDVTLGTGGALGPTTRNMHSSASSPTSNALVANSLFGSSRSASGSYAARVNGQNYVLSIASASPTAGNIGLFRLSQTSSYAASDTRFAFYSIGESLDLALLDSRVTQLMTGIASALPLDLDVDAAAYISAVEAADGQSLELGVKLAVDRFVVGCKADGIWSAIKASCILAGARTLAGALVPLAGTAPTNNNFVSGDYDRKTGLVGDGSTKYLSTNRNNNTDPQNSKHLSTYVTSAATSTQFAGNIGFYSAGSGSSYIGRSGASAQLFLNSGASIFGSSAGTGFQGVSRDSSAGYAYRLPLGQAGSLSVASITPANGIIQVFSALSGLSSNARLAFYSIGESLDLTLLDARVTQLMADLAAAIP